MSVIKNQQFTATLAGDETVAMFIYYNGSGVTASIDMPGADSGSLIFTDDETGATLPDDGTTVAGTLVLSVATVDSLGELTDVINASTNFRAVMVAGLRASLVNDLFTDTNNLTFTNDNRYDIFWDNGATLQGKICIGPEADTLLRVRGRLSTETIGRKEPLEGVSATGIAVENRDNRPLSSSRVHRVFHNTRDADVYLDSHVEVFTASQQADRLLFRDAGRVLATLNGEPGTEVDWSDVPIVSDPGERIVILTVDGGTVDAMEMSVVGAYGPPGGKDTA